MSVSATTERRVAQIWVLALLCFGVAALYWPTLNAGFFADDGPYVVMNFILATLPASGLGQLLQRPFNPAEFLPLRDFSYWIDFRLFGENARGFHLHNLLLYLIGILASWFAARSLMRFFAREERAVRWLPIGVALLFALHPAHVEAVAWISSRKDLLSGALMLLATGLFCHARAPDGWRLRWLLPAALLFVLAALAKATALVALAWVALLIAVDRVRSGRWDWQPLLVGAALLVVMVGVFSAQLHFGGALGIQLTAENAPASALVGSADRALRILGTLVQVAVWPLDTRLYYDVFDPAQAVGRYIAVAGLLLAVLAGLWHTLRRGASWGLAPAFLLLCLLPYLQTVPFITSSLASERFLYLGVFAVAWLAAELALRLRREVGVAGLLLLALGCASLTSARVADWRDQGRLLAREGQVSPHYYYAQLVWVGEGLMPAGRFADGLDAAGRIRDARARAALLEVVRMVATTRLASERGQPEFARRSFSTAQVMFEKGVAEADFRDLPLLAFYRQLGLKIDHVFRFLLQQMPNDERMIAQYAGWRERMEKLRVLMPDPGPGAAPRR